METENVRSRKQFGEHAKCAECDQALVCMAGSLPVKFVVRKLQPSFGHPDCFLPCIDEGKTKLVHPAVMAVFAMPDSEFMNMFRNKKL